MIRLKVFLTIVLGALAMSTLARASNAEQGIKRPEQPYGLGTAQAKHAFAEDEPKTKKTKAEEAKEKKQKAKEKKQKAKEKKQKAKEEKERKAQEKKEKKQREKAEKKRKAEEKKEKAKEEKARKAREKKEKLEAAKAEKERKAKEKEEAARLKKEEREKKKKSKAAGKGKKEPEVEPEPIVLEEEPPPPPTTEAEAETAEARPALVEEEQEPEEEPPAESREADGKFYLGLRVGYGLPMGDAAGDAGAALDGFYTGKLPLWVDLGYRLSPSFLIGVYGQYGIAFVADAQCIEGQDCSGSVLRFGLQIQYNFAPAATLDPWLGLGFGYEIASGQAGVATFELKGFEFANLQAGLDYKVSAAVGVGPFVSFSLGRYALGEFEGPLGTQRGEITEKALHQWLVLGLRVAFAL
jgi:outer membrane protein